MNTHKVFLGWAVASTEREMVSASEVDRQQRNANNQRRLSVSGGSTTLVNISWPTYFCSIQDPNRLVSGAASTNPTVERID